MDFRGAAKKRLVDTFVTYVSRTRAAADDRDKALIHIDAQSKRTKPEFKVRDHPR